jgi:tRNA(Ile)-lysidine synthase
MLTDSFLAFINKEKLFKKEDHLLLAISGGVDSVVLAHLLYQTGYKYSLAHMNFQLRGNDSLLDEAFVENLAKKLNVTCHVKQVVVEKGQAKLGGSTQMQARNFRYNWFSELLTKYNYAKLLTAHHAEDSFETALLNLSRGTGIKGLRGILPASSTIVRPLLFTDKSTILAYAQKNNLQWREDISNQSDDYKRNDIRHHVIPKLKGQNPKLFEGFNTSSLKLRAAEEAYDEKIALLKQKYLFYKADQIMISKKILNLKFGLVYLSEFLKPYHFSLQQLLSFSFNQSGAHLEGVEHNLSVDREVLIISVRRASEPVRTTIKFGNNRGDVKVSAGRVNHHLEWDLLDVADFVQASPKNVALIDFALLKEPLVLRTWKEGDKMKPLGMRGKKKVSDILIDDKTSMPDKEKQLVLESDGEIVWLINRRISEIFKITEQTSTILRLKYIEII